MMTHKVSITLLLILFVITPLLCAEERLKNIDDRLELNFFILESAVREGAFISGDLEELGFTRYDGLKLPKKKDLEKRMYTFRAVFYLDESLKNQDLAVHLGPADYPFHLYLNGVELFMWGRYGEHYNSTYYRSPNILLPPQLLAYGARKNEIAIQIFPRYETRPLGTVTILSYSRGMFNSFFRDLFNIHLIQGSCMIAFVLF